MHKVNKKWLYDTVKPYFATQGIKLLKDDMLFIEKCLSNIPQHKHRFVLRDYLNIFLTHLHENNIEQSSPINVRYEANTYLRNISGI